MNITLIITLIITLMITLYFGLIVISLADNVYVLFSTCYKLCVMYLLLMRIRYFV